MAEEKELDARLGRLAVVCPGCDRATSLELIGETYRCGKCFTIVRNPVETMAEIIKSATATNTAGLYHQQLGELVRLLITHGFATSDSLLARWAQEPENVVFTLQERVRIFLRDWE